MGNWQWKLETIRMVFYVAFPVGLFYYFNHPAFYQKRILGVAMSCDIAELKEQMEQQMMKEENLEMAEFLSEYNKQRLAKEQIHWEAERDELIKSKQKKQN